MIKNRMNYDFMCGQDEVIVKPCDMWANLHVDIEAPLSKPDKCEDNTELVSLITFLLQYFS